MLTVDTPVWGDEWCIKEALTCAISLLGVPYDCQDQQEEAVVIFQRASQGFEKTLGPDRAGTLKIVYSLGDFYTEQGRREEAMAMYQRASQDFEKAFGTALWSSASRSIQSLQ